MRDADRILSIPPAPSVWGSGPRKEPLDGAKNVLTILRTPFRAAMDTAGVGASYPRRPRDCYSYLIKRPFPLSQCPASARVVRRSPAPPPPGPARSDPAPGNKSPVMGGGAEAVGPPASGASAL